MEKKLGFKVLACFMVLTIVASLFNFSRVKAQIGYPLPVSYIDYNFPDSYKSYIDKMKAAHPNWTFKAVHLNLDWNTALSHETYEVNEGISLVEDIYGSEWKRDGKNYYQDGNYVTASKAGVAYVMDPRNFLNDQGIFMFEALVYSEASQTTGAVQAVLAPTLMGSTRKSQYQSYGTWKDLGTTYAELIARYGKEVGINPVHIASRIRQENSGNLATNKLIDGHNGLYNFFNIGAYDNQYGSAVTNGLTYAKNHGWTNVGAALKGGMQYIYDKYIKYGQNTIYFERFDVNNPGSGQWLLGTGYMTNIFAPRSEALITYNAYNSYGMLNLPFEFHIPVYDNMPSYASPMPTPNGVYFVDDNTRVYLDDPSDSGVTDEFWIRSGPDTSSSIVEKIYENQEGQNNRTQFTRTGIGYNTLYDRIRFDDGRVGYILKKWVHEVTYTRVTGVALNTTYTNMSVGNSMKLTASVSPQDANNKNVKWTTSDSSIVSVDQNGNVNALKSGVATITVVTVDQSKSATCTINVIQDKVTSISIPESEYELTLGSSTVITPIFNPTTAKNTNYTVTSSNTAVATINGHIIIAQGEGTTTLTFKSEDGGHTATTILKVVSQDKEQIVVDEPLKLENKYITGLDLTDNTVDAVSGKIRTGYNVKFVDINGKEIFGTELVGTGTKIQFSKNNAVEEEYTVVIYGDVDGSGVINARDLLVLQRYLLNKTELSQIQVKASITDKKAQAPNASDLLKIQRHILGKYTIEQ